MTRFSARTLEVTVTTDGTRVTLRAPGPGLFLPRMAAGELVTRGSAIGDLEVLGRRTALIAPDVAGIVITADTRTVAFGESLVELDTAQQLGASAAADPASTATATTGLVFRSPMSGRFYTRSAPDKAPFVEVGTSLTTGATVCLLEVMKTFNRVTYGGAGLPPTAKVKTVLVQDGADVIAGQPLLALE